MKTEFKQNTIAIVYDFDETLSPKPMQEYTILKESQDEAYEFWESCTSEAKKYNADPMLTYMRLLLDKMHQKAIKKTDLQDLAQHIDYFTGVESWFARINNYVKHTFNNEVQIKHYIISAGMKEILDGIVIKDNFDKIFASEYYFDNYGKPVFPTVVVNAAVKTQYLFQINKGTTKINDHMENEKRAIPFENILYIGDGETDVPCMTITKNNGGYAMAVYNAEKDYDKEEQEKKIMKCKSLLQANRVDYFSPANYNENTDLDKKVKLIINAIGSNILLKKEKFIKNNF